MKKWNRILGTLFIVWILFVGCDASGGSSGTNTDEGSTGGTGSVLVPGTGNGSFTIGNTTGTLSYGWLERDTVTNSLDIYLSSILPQSTGSGDFLNISIPLSQELLNPGEYSTQQNSILDISCGIGYNRSVTPATFTELWILDESAEPNTILTVTKNGDTYTLTYTLCVISPSEEDSGTITGSYTGTLPLF